MSQVRPRMALNVSWAASTEMRVAASTWRHILCTIEAGDEIR